MKESLRSLIQDVGDLIGWDWEDEEIRVGTIAFCLFVVGLIICLIPHDLTKMIGVILVVIGGLGFLARITHTMGTDRGGTTGRGPK